MRNEIILIISLFLIFGSTLAWFALFGKTGLKCLTCVFLIAANIEVLILVRAFGMEQTLGNVLFAATFLITDIMSEIYGKKESTQTVYIGVAASVTFVILSQLWLMYVPSSSDFVSPSIRTIFSNTPRLIFASLSVNLIVQQFDVWAYHKWWAFTEKKCGDKRRYLWLRNNASTLIAQLLNTILFNCVAFVGVYSVSTLINIILSGYVIFIVTSLADTPFVYLARKINDLKERKRE